MTSRVAAVAFRLFFAGASIVAMAYQFFGIHIPKGYNAVNFFTFFTNLANILISVVFIVAAVRALRNRPAPSSRDTAIRGSAVVYIAFVGVVFNTLLRDTDLSDLSPWVNIVLHYVLPIAGVVDWVLWPPRNRLPVRFIWWWMLFPAVYAAFSLIRGALTGRYPYPFFNPAAVGGYGSVALLCLAMLVGFLVLSFAVRLVGNWRGGFLRASA